MLTTCSICFIQTNERLLIKKPAQSAAFGAWSSATAHVSITFHFVTFNNKETPSCPSVPVLQALQASGAQAADVEGCPHPSQKRKHPRPNLIPNCGAWLPAPEREGPQAQQAREAQQAPVLQAQQAQQAPVPQAEEQAPR